MAKKYAEQGIVELSGTGSASMSYDGRAGAIALSPSLNYFFVPHWYFSTSFSFVYSTFNPNGDDSTNVPVLWRWAMLPAIDFGYARAFTEHWYWFISVGYSVSFLDCAGCQTHGFYGRALNAKVGLKYDVGNGLLIMGINEGGIIPYGTIAFGYSTFFGYSIFF